MLSFLKLGVVMEIREKIDIIRAVTDILLKAKLMFFSGLVGGVVYMLVNYDEINKFINEYVLLIAFVVLGIYAILGVVLNIIDLTQIMQ